MLFHFLKRIFSSLWRERENSLLTMVSLAIGLSVSSLIYLHVKQEISHDRLWPDSQVIYRVLKETVGTGTVTATPMELLTSPLSGYLDDLAETTAWASRLDANILHEDRSVHMVVHAVDLSFLDIFHTEVLAGDLGQVLRQPGLIALEVGQARAMFGDATAAIGATVTIEGVSGLQFVNGAPIATKGEDVTLEVGAIYGLPEPVSSATTFNALIMREALSSKLLPIPAVALSTLWIKLVSEAVSPPVQQALDTYAEQGYGAQQAPGSYKLRLEPLRDIYFHSAENPLLSAHGDIKQLATFIAVGVLVLLVSATNAVCINLAAMAGRIQEVGILKSLGAERSQIALQFVGEAVALALLALLPALGLIELLRPAFEGLLSVPALPSLSGLDVVMLVGFAAVLGVIVGYYPAFILARQKPMRSLMPSFAALKGGLNFRMALLAGQFAVAIFLVVATLAVYAQLQVTVRQPIGFVPANLAAVQGDFGSGVQSATVLMNELERIPGVRMARGINNQPNTQGMAFSSEVLLVRTLDQASGVSVQNRTIGFDSFALMRTRMLAGREFARQRDVDYLEGGQPQAVERIVINHQAAAAFGFSDADEAVGARLYLRRGPEGSVVHQAVEVIGVVQDSMYFDLTRRPSAEIYRLMPTVQNASAAFILLQYDPAVADTLQRAVVDTWQRVGGQPPNSVFFIDDQIAAGYAPQRQEGQLILICAGAALLLTTLGLYGAVSVAMRSSLKEIGVRKVLGSGALQIALVFLKKFLNPLLLANLLAWPLALGFAVRWVERFPYQLDRYWLLPLCVLATVLVLVISWTTVGWLSDRVARVRPVKCLRYE